MSVLICDSNCELWYTKLRELGVDYIAMPYCIGGTEYYYDLGEKTDFQAFYSEVKNGKTPTTMALNPENYKEILRPYFERGEDVFYVSFSHAMSGTFDQLDKAIGELREEFPDRTCTVFDTNSISIGAGLQVEAAARAKNAGADDKEILRVLRSLTDKVAVYFFVDDLMHLKRGGRLSATSAIAGTVLGIKPVLTLDKNGRLTVLSKVVGRRKAIRALAEKAIAELKDDSYSVYVVDADCKADADELANMIREKRPEAKVVRQIVGPVIGAHCGRGTIGVIFISDKRPVPLCEEAVRGAVSVNGVKTELYEAEAALTGENND